MLSRGPSSRMRRAKSSSSVTTHSVDPEVGHQHALAAASYAFERANSRANALLGRVETEPFTTTDSSIDDGQGLRRRQSVRFTGPLAVPNEQRPITRREAPLYQDYRTSFQGTRPSLGHEGSSLSRPDSIVTALPPLSENGGETNNLTSSSYRRLRKAKSLFNARKPLSFAFSNDSSKSEDIRRSPYRRLSSSIVRPMQKDELSQASSASPRLGSNHILYTTRPNPNQDAAIQLARDQYLLQLEQQRLRERPSFLNLSKHVRPQKAFRRTVRTSSSNSYGSAILSPGLSSTVKGKRFGLRARNISSSLKDRLKRVFQRIPPSGDPLPVQQLDASRPHFRDYMASSSELDRERYTIPRPDEELLHRVDSRASSLHRLPIHLGRGGPPGSIRSVHSNDSLNIAKSRVTSWTDSTAANTLTSNQLKEHLLLEKKRLSIIQENGGPYQPSSGAAQAGSKTQSGYSIFRKPLGNNDGSKIVKSLDSQRVFSALQKKLHEDIKRLERGKKIAENQRGSPQILSDTMNQDFSNGTSAAYDMPTLSNASRKTNSSINRYESANSSMSNLVSSGKGDEMFGSTVVDVQSHLPDSYTPQQIAEHNERIEKQRKGPVREVKSVFFPPTTHFQTSRTNPYRRAILAGTDGEDGADMDSGKLSAKARRRTPSYAKYVGLQSVSGTRSESTYSRSTGGETPKVYQTPPLFVRSDSYGEPGTAVITTSSVEYSHQTATPSVHHRNPSIQSSGEWKGWMAAEVAHLEDRFPKDFRIYDAYPMDQIYHRRENAEINGEEIQVRPRRPSRLLENQPLASINFDTSSELSQRSSTDIMVERFPLLERKASFSANSIKHDKPSSRPRPTSFPRQHSVAENQNFGSTLIYPKPRNIRLSTSMASIGSQNNHGFIPGALADTTNIGAIQAKESPKLTSSHDKFHSRSTANMDSRYSPERTARLRRMRSAKTQEPRPFPLGQHLQENQAINDYTPPTSPREDYGIGIIGTLEEVNTEKHSQRDKMMIEQFLNERRDRTRTDEGSGGSPAFL